MQHTACHQAAVGPAVIERVETMLVDLPTIRPHKLSMAVMNGQTLMLVRIRCSDGTVGLGEGTTIGGLAYGAESPEGMKLAIDSEAGRTRYGRRFATVEPVFGNLRHNKRLDRFTLRGRKKVDTQWKLYCLVHNIEKLAHHGFGQ